MDASLKEPMVWAMVMQTVADGLRRRGRPPEPLFARCGIPLAWLDDPYREVPLRHYVELFERAAVEAGDADFGLFAARSYTPFSMGPVGLLFASSVNLGAALRSFCAHMAVMQQGTQCVLIEDRAVCTFRYRVAAPRLGAKRQDAEFSLAATASLIRSLAGARWRPTEVWFEHAAPPSVRAHARAFGAPVRFDQPFNALEFPVADLAIRGGMVDSRVHPIVEHHLGVLRRRQVAGRSLADRIGGIIDEHLPGTGRDLTAAAAARAAGFSPRTLQRALRRDGASFGRLKSDRRRALAERLLADAALSITEIAFMLNYADTACFTRACRRWFGVTPSDYRRRAPERPPTPPVTPPARSPDR